MSIVIDISEGKLIISKDEFKNLTRETIKNLLPLLKIEKPASKVISPPSRLSILTIKETAKLLHKSKASIYTYIKQGIIPVHTLGGSKVKYIKEKDVEKALIRIPFPQNNLTYPEYETLFRKALKRGRIFQEKLFIEFQETPPPHSISTLCRWLYENGHHDIIRGAVYADFINQLKP